MQASKATGKIETEHVLVCVCVQDLVAGRMVSQSQAEQKAFKLHVPYVECSAKDNEGVSEIFYEVVKLILKQGVYACC